MTPTPSALPKIIDATTRIKDPGELPKEVIKGLLYKRSKLVLGGGSKTFKTWSLLSLAIAVASGSKWLDFTTTRAKVLFINLELQPEFINRRIAEIATAMQVVLEPGWLHVWDLRGYVAGYKEFIPRLADTVQHEGYELSFLDPIYKTLGEADENSATDVTGLLNSMESFCKGTNSALIYSGHFSKGDQSGKHHMDRVSGSGAFARDADTILTFTRHKEDHCYTVEATLRNHAPMDPFVAQWEHPLMKRTKLDPLDLHSQRGPEEKYSPDDVLGLLSVNGMRPAEWIEEAEHHLGLSRTTFHNKRRQLEEDGKIVKVGDVWKPAK